MIGRNGAQLACLLLVGLAAIGSAAAQGLDDQQKAEVDRAKRFAKRAAQVAEGLGNSELDTYQRHVFKRGHGYFSKLEKSIGYTTDVIDVVNALLRLEQTLDCLERSRDCLIDDAQPHCRTGMAIGAYNLFQIAAVVADKAPLGPLKQLGKFYSEILKGSSNAFLRVKKVAGECRGHTAMCETLCASGEAEDKVFCNMLGQGVQFASCKFLEDEFPGERPTATATRVAKRESRGLLDDMHTALDHWESCDLQNKYSDFCDDRRAEIRELYEEAIIAESHYDELSWLEQHLTDEGEARQAAFEAAICATRQRLVELRKVGIVNFLNGIPADELFGDIERLEQYADCANG